MSKDKNTEIEKYLNEVKSYLLCDNGTKKKLIDDLHNDIDSYVNETGESDIEKIKANFGEADDIARAFLSVMDIKDVKKKLDKKRAIIKVLIIAVIIALLIWGLGVTYALYQEYNSNGHIDTVLTETDNTAQTDNGAIEYFDGDIV